MKLTPWLFLTLIACAIGLGFLWGRSGEPVEDLSKESESFVESLSNPQNSSEEPIVEKLLSRKKSSTEEALASLPSGISEWKEHYRVRLSKTVVEIMPDEPVGWTGDSKTVEEFRRLLDQELLEYSLDPGSMVSEKLNQLYIKEAHEFIAQFQNEGRLLSFDPGLVGLLLPHELFSLVGSLRQLSRGQDPNLVAYGVFPNIFQSSPEDYFGARGVILGNEERQQLQDLYDGAFLPWLLVKAEQDQLRYTASSVARDNGLLPPPRKWLPNLLPRYEELSVEIGFYESQLEGLYGGVVELEGSDE